MKKYESEETSNLESQSSNKKTLKNKSKLQEELTPSESQFAAIKIDNDTVDKLQDPTGWRLKIKKFDGDESRPHNFNFPVRYVTEFSTKCEKKVRRCENSDVQCQICSKDVVDDCGHYQYNTKWRTYTLITCCFCKAKGKHWGSQCPEKDNFKPDLSEFLSEFKSHEEIPWTRIF